MKFRPLPPGEPNNPSTATFRNNHSFRIGPILYSHPLPLPNIRWLGAAAEVRGSTQLAAVAKGIEEAAVARGTRVAARHLLSQTGLVQPYTATRRTRFAVLGI